MSDVKVGQVWSGWKGESVTIALFGGVSAYRYEEWPVGEYQRMPLEEIARWARLEHWTLIQDVPDAAPAYGHAEHTAAYQELLHELYDNEPMRNVVGYTPVPPQPAPRYAVGDRFAHADGRFFELRAPHIEGWTTVASWCDGHKYWFDGIRVLCWAKLHGFAHVAGPTFQPPARKPPRACNCSAQVTGSQHRDWCRTRGKEG